MSSKPRTLWPASGRFYQMQPGEDGMVDWQLRWAPIDGKDDFERMGCADNGAWVKYTDYAKLEAELNLTKDKLKLLENVTGYKVA